jgi:hypothetical protein
MHGRMGGWVVVCVLQSLKRIYAMRAHLSERSYRSIADHGGGSTVHVTVKGKRGGGNRILQQQRQQQRRGECSPPEFPLHFRRGGEERARGWWWAPPHHSSVSTADRFRLPGLWLHSSSKPATTSPKSCCCCCNYLSLAAFPPPSLFFFLARFDLISPPFSFLLGRK